MVVGGVFCLEGKIFDMANELALADWKQNKLIIHWVVFLFLFFKTTTSSSPVTFYGAQTTPTYSHVQGEFLGWGCR